MAEIATSLRRFELRRTGEIRSPFPTAAPPLSQRAIQRIALEHRSYDGAVAGLGLRGPQVGASTSGTRGEAAQGPALINSPPRANESPAPGFLPPTCSGKHSW